MSEEMRRAPRFLDSEVLTRAMEESGLDAAIVMSPKNVWYMSGHTRMLSSAQRPGGSAAGLVVATRSGDPTLVVSRWHANIAKAMAWTGEIVAFRNYAESAFLLAARVLEERGLANGQVGLEMDYVPDGDYRDLIGALPEATFLDLGRTIDSIRVRRSAEQLERSHEAFERLGTAVLAGLQRARIGYTRLSIHNTVMREVLRGGSDSIVGGIGLPSQTIVPLVSTEDVAVEDGDVLTLDYMCAFGPFAARISRTVVAGEARPHLQEAYQKHRRALLTSIDQMRPGMAASEASRLVHETFVANGMPCRYPLVGHGVSHAFEDAPIISPDSTDVLEEGMEFVLEPRAAGGLRLSLRVVVAPDGMKAFDAGFPAEAPYVISR